MLRKEEKRVESESGREKRGSGISELGVNQLQHHLLLWGYTDHVQLYAAD